MKRPDLATAAIVLHTINGGLLVAGGAIALIGGLVFGAVVAAAFSSIFAAFASFGAIAGALFVIIGLIAIVAGAIELYVAHLLNTGRGYLPSLIVGIAYAVLTGLSGIGALLAGGAALATYLARDYFLSTPPAPPAPPAG